MTVERPSDTSDHLKAARGHIDEALKGVEGSSDNPLTARSKKKKSRGGSAVETKGNKSPSKKISGVAPLIGKDPGIGSNLPDSDPNPPIAGENENFSPIPIPLYDNLFLLTLKCFESGDENRTLDAHSQTYVESTGLMSRGDLHALNPKEVMVSLVERVKGKFEVYMFALELQISGKLAKDGIRIVDDFRSPYGESDEYSPKSVKKRIAVCLWQGTLGDQKEENEKRIRDQETRLFDAHVRANGIGALGKYFEHNEVLSQAEIHGQSPSQLTDYFKTRVEDIEGDEAQRIASAGFDESLEQRDAEKYKKEAIGFMGIVGELKDDAKVKFKSHKDVVGFIEKLKLISRDSKDPLNETANKIHRALVEAINAKQEVPRKPLAIRLFRKIPLIGKIGSGKAEKTGPTGRLPSADEPSVSENSTRRLEQSDLRDKYVVGPFGAAVLGSTALFAVLGGGGAFLLGEHFGKGNVPVRDNVPTNNNTLNIGSGANVSNINQGNNTGGDIYGLVDTRIPTEAATIPSAATQTPLGGSEGTFGGIKYASQLSQQDAKKILDKTDGKEDENITFTADSNGSFDSSIEGKFKLLGANAHDLEKDKEYIRPYILANNVAGKVVLDSLGQDVLILSARLAGTNDGRVDGREIPQDTQSVIRTIDARPDTTITLIHNYDPKPVGGAKATPTAESTPAQTATKSPTAQPDKTSTAVGTRTPTATATSTISAGFGKATPAVDTPNATPRTGEISRNGVLNERESRKYEREQMFALAYANNSRSDRWLPFASMPILGGFVLSRDYRALSKSLRKLLGLDDDEDDEEENNEEYFGRSS